MIILLHLQGYGFAEVEQMYGLDTTRAAAEQLKSLYGGKGHMKLKLFISVKGIKLFDHYSMVSRVNRVRCCLEGSLIMLFNTSRNITQP